MGHMTNPHIAEMGGSITEWAGYFPVSLEFYSLRFYLVPAVAFGFMLHCRKRDRQRYSEACLPVLWRK